MTSTELCEVIDCCGRNKVHTISIAGVEIAFGAKLGAIQEHVDDSYFASLESSKKIEDNVVNDSPQLDLQELAYSDPERYEKIMQGDIDA